MTHLDEEVEEADGDVDVEKAMSRLEPTSIENENLPL